MKYSKLISKRKQYKYSANICFDLENENRLSGFIPNVTTTEILKEYLYGIIQDKAGVHSRILYGSYGTGKSHLLTVLCALLGHINTDGEAFSIFEDSIRNYDSDFADFIKGYVNEKKPFLVVPVYSDFSDFDKCISYSLKKELERKGYEVSFKNTFFEALALIENWEQGEESVNRLREVCENLNIDINEFKNSLKTFESNSEKKFNEVFKEMTYGASFVSETGSLIDNLNQANEVVANNYRGIVFVFDEFGRYIEDNGETIKVKTIQDFAEYCDHSNFDNYFILVSHKQLSLYTDKMKKELSDEWKKIEGRFKATSINVKYDQCLSLIPHIIPKTSKWNDFKNAYKEKLNQLYEQGWDFKGFLLPPEGGDPFEGGFPLHPITLYALDRLSKKVAQNERTFFTYLASDEENSLFAQLDRLEDNQFHFVGLDAIYDYFEENIMSFRANDIYLTYKKLQYALNKLGETSDDYTEIRILKAIAVINIISDSAILASNRTTLCNVIDAEEKLVSKAIDNLEKKKIIKFMRQYGYYDFLDSSIYDLDSMIEEKVGAINDEAVVNILNDEFSDFVIYPHRYNSVFHMNRIMIPVFAFKGDLLKKSFVRSMPEFYDGIVAFVLDSDYDKDEYIGKDIPDRTLLLIDRDPKQIIFEVKRYIATKLLYSKKEELKKDDPTVEKEIQLYLEEERAILNEYITNWRTFKSKSVLSIVEDKEDRFDSEEELTEAVSKIMFKAFGETIIVNNDLINKNKISGTIRLSRTKLLDNMLNDEDVMTGCTPLSPEHNIVRAVLVKNGFYDDGIPASINYLENGKQSGEAVRAVIKKYVKDAKKAPVCLDELYSKLKKAPYGLRDGYMPLLLAFELQNQKNISLSFHGADRECSSEEFLKAFESPEDYSIFICQWDEAQEKYISGLEVMYGKYLPKKSKNRLKELLDAMNTHFANLSKSALTTDRYVSDKTKLYRDIMSVSYKDYNAFFFEVLTRIDSDFNRLLVQLDAIKKELENVVTLQMSDVNKLIRNMFGIKDEGLGRWLSEKYGTEWSSKAHKVFDYHTNAFLEYVKNIDPNKCDEVIIQELANVITSFGLDYWNDSKIEDFEEILRKAISQIEGYVVSDEITEDEIKIVIQSGGEELRTTQFDKQDLSGNGQIMFNKMKATINNFGQSISQEEKMQIIARLLEEIM